MKNTSKGLRHFFKAFRYSIEGFEWIWQKEVAFRHDTIFSIVAIITVGFATNFDILRMSIVVIATLLLLIVELLNSAIECVVDLVSPEYHILAKAAKDMCSAAVFIIIIVDIITILCTIILPL